MLDKDILKAAVLPEEPGEDEPLFEEGWDKIVDEE